ncbi:MAG: hypothetical protein M1115_09765 [Actinobacteria bacterium]|nr:hypothetical protein [Actinomycetota bacterium]
MSWKHDNSGWLTRRNLQVALGCLWILDGALQLQPYMYSPGSNGFLGPIADQSTITGPNPITDLIRVALVVFVSHQVLVNTLIAVVQLAIGAGLLWRRTERVALGASMAWGLGVWIVGEGVGALIFPQTSMMFTGAPGAALIYVLVSLTLWPRRSSSQASSVASGGLLGASGSIWAWAVVWCGDALLELERGNHARQAISAQVAQLARDEPAALAAMDRWFAHASSGAGIEIAGALLLLEFAAGWLALRKWALKPALAMGIGLSLIFWVLGQNFGTILTGKGTDPNLGPVMVLFALALWPCHQVPVEKPPERTALQPQHTVEEPAHTA